MANLLTCLILMVTAQNSEPPSSTYIFQLQDGREYYVRSYREERNSRGQLLYIIETDEPWRPTTRTIRASDLAPGYPVRELPNARQQRIEQGWAERGYQLVTLPSGERRPIPQSEYELAERARQWALAVDAYIEEQDRGGDPDPPDVPVDETQLAPSEASDPTNHSDAGRWLLAATIVAVAAVLIGVLFKTLILA